MEYEIVSNINKVILNFIEKTNGRYLMSSSFFLSSWLKNYQKTENRVKCILLKKNNAIIQIFPFIETFELFYKKKIKLWKFIGNRGPLYNPHNNNFILNNYDALFQLLKKDKQFSGICKLYFWNDNISDIHAILEKYQFYSKSDNDKGYGYIKINTEGKPENRNLTSTPPRNLRRKLIKINELGNVEFVCVSPEDHEFYANLYMQFSIDKWRLKGMDCKYNNELHARHTTDLIHNAYINNVLKIYCLRVEKKVIAMRIGFEINNIFYDFYTAFDQKHKDYSPGLVLLYYMFQDFYKKNKDIICDMGAGVQDYKMRFIKNIHESSVLYFGKNRYQWEFFCLFSEHIPKLWDSTPDTLKDMIRKALNKSKIITKNDSIK